MYKNVPQLSPRDSLLKEDFLLHEMHQGDAPTIIFSRDHNTGMCSVSASRENTVSGSVETILGWNRLLFSEREFLAKIHLVMDSVLAATLEAYHGEAFFLGAYPGFLLRTRRANGQHVWLQCVDKSDDERGIHLVFTDSALTRIPFAPELFLPHALPLEEVDFGEMAWETNITTRTNSSSETLNAYMGDSSQASRSSIEGLAYVHPDDRDLVLQSVSDVIAGQKTSFICETRVMHANGHFIWCELRGHAVNEDDSYKLVGTLRDISSRKRAQDELIRLITLYQSVVSMTADVVWEQTFGLTPLCTYSGPPDSPFDCVNCTLPLEEAIHFTHPDDRECTRELQRQIGTGEIESFVQEVRFKNTSGVYVWIEKRGRSIRDTHGVLQKVVGSFQDISERRHNRRKNHELAHHYQTLAKLAADAIWEYSLTDGSFHLTATIEAMLGYVPEELPTLDAMLALIHHDDRNRVRKKFQTAEKLSTFKPFRTTYRMCHRNGTWRHFENRVAPLTNLDGKFERIIGALRDITEQIDREAELQRQTATDSLTGLYSRQAERKARSAYAFY